MSIAILALLAVGWAPSHAKATTYAYVNVTLSGNGSGHWQTTNSADVPDGLIDCFMVDGVVDPQASCDAQYDVTNGFPTIYAIAVPDPGNCVVTPDGCGKGLGRAFILSTEVQAEVASFIKVMYAVAVTKGGAGSGTVLDNFGTITCGTDCGLSIYSYGAHMILTAKPAAGSYFSEWTGACAGKGATCSFTITANVATTAVFGLGTPTPGPTPKATTKPTPKPTTTATSQPSAPVATNAPLPTSSAETDGPPSLPPAPSGSKAPGEEPITGSPSAIAVVIDPSSTGGASNSGLLALAILAAGLLIAIGLIGSAALRRRPSA